MFILNDRYVKDDQLKLGESIHGLYNDFPVSIRSDGNHSNVYLSPYDVEKLRDYLTEVLYKHNESITL